MHQVSEVSKGRSQGVGRPHQPRRRDCGRHQDRQAQLSRRRVSIQSGGVASKGTGHYPKGFDPERLQPGGCDQLVDALGRLRAWWPMSLATELLSLDQAEKGVAVVLLLRSAFARGNR